MKTGKRELATMIPAITPPGLSRKVQLINEMGIHARSAAKIVKLAQQARSEVWVIRNSEKVSAKNMFDILSIACPAGEWIEFTVDDPFDSPVLQALIDMTELGFGEINDQDHSEIRLAGVPASPGLFIGRAYVVDVDSIQIIKKYYIRAAAVPDEVKRFKSAVKKTRDDIVSIIHDAYQDIPDHSDILQTHISILNDRMLYGKTLETIETERINAEWALKKVTSSLRSRFNRMADPYLKERALDIVHVSDRILINLAGGNTADISRLDRQVILVAKDISPAQAIQIKQDTIRGFITDLGGKTSHTGIIARSLHIPAVMGLQTATTQINMDDLLIVDGSSGVVVIHPNDKTLVEYGLKKIDYEIQRARLLQYRHVESRTLDGIRLGVMGNIEIPDEAGLVLENGGDGIGLYRTEFQYLGRMDFPKEEELFESYRLVVQQMGSRPVTIRTLDINGDKALNHAPASQEPNPALGLRAIRYCMKRPDIFKCQIRAILRAAYYGNVRILLPMISGCEEILETRKIVSIAGEELKQEQLPHSTAVQVGIMVEVPSAVILAEMMAGMVDFFSIGTNDLIQFSLAIDRGNRDVAYLYSPLHPAIIRMIRMVTDAGRKYDVKTYMCGEMAGDPLNIPVLLGLELDEISMNPQSIPIVKQMIASLRQEECRNLVTEVMELKTTREVLDLVNKQYGGLLAEEASVPPAIPETPDGNDPRSVGLP